MKRVKEDKRVRGEGGGKGERVRGEERKVK